MKKQKRVVLTSVVLCLMGLTSVFAQNDKHIKRDTTRQDKTRLVQEKNIRDTTKDTATHKSGKKKHNDSIYVVPDKGKRKKGSKYSLTH